jgi:hypothetical protein
MMPSPTRRKDRPRCGAKTRAGGACLVRAEPGKPRCRFHGGFRPAQRRRPGARGSLKHSGNGGALTARAGLAGLIDSKFPSIKGCGGAPDFGSSTRVRASWWTAFWIS